MKIAVLLSGGVDSSVALQLLKNEGHDVRAFYLKIWLEDELAYLGDCPWEEDLRYAQATCTQLNVPLSIIPLQKEYWDTVVAYTIAEVKAGRTPSPDIMCNQRVKFGFFLQKIDGSFDKIATGHYASLARHNGLWQLLKAKDPIKDQTYFLSALNQQQLSRLVFPIGTLLKTEVRALAQQYNLPTMARKDSQGICFLGKIKFSDFIRHHLGTQDGDLIEFETGQKLGTHEGFWYYTIGQRKGLGLSGGPWFVVSKDTQQNIVYISNRYYTPDKQRNQFAIAAAHWIAGTPPPPDTALEGKIRHGEHCYPCTIALNNAHEGVVTIQGNDQGLAPGQFAVFYANDVCLGSAVIAQESGDETIP